MTRQLLELSVTLRVVVSELSQVVEDEKKRLKCVFCSKYAIKTVSFWLNEKVVTFPCCEEHALSLDRIIPHLRKSLERLWLELSGNKPVWFGDYLKEETRRFLT